MKMLPIALAFAALTGPALAQDGPPPGPRGGGMMMRADADGDGVVTRAEALAQAGERFDRMDVNGDGKLTADEMQRPPRPGRPGDTPPPAR